MLQFTCKYSRSFKREEEKKIILKSYREARLVVDLTSIRRSETRLTRPQRTTTPAKDDGETSDSRDSIATKTSRAHFETAKSRGGGS